VSDATTPVPGETPKLTFEGVTFNAFATRARPFVLLRATIGCGLLLVAIYGLFVWLCWPLIVATVSWYGEFFAFFAANTQPPEQAPWSAFPPPAYFQLVGGLHLLSFLVYIVIASWEAACLRWLVRGETGGLFLGLGLGADTWRIWLGYWIWFFFLFAAILVLYLPLTFLVISAIFASSARGEINPTSEATQILAVVPLLMLAWIALVIWVAVRFAPAAAVSVALRRFAFHLAWNATRGRFWTLFGAYASWIAFYVVAFLVIYAIALLVILAPAFASLATARGQPDPGVLLTALTTPRTWISVLVCYATLLVVAATTYVGLFGVNARAAVLAKAEGRIS
jgi:hypothetical protein